MKMKKLLAGILSATMVATMIPASMAFSGVSAEGTNEDSFVAYYDFTAGETNEWAPYTVTQANASTDYNTYTNTATGVEVNESGLNITAGAHGYGIDNPLQNQVTNGWTVSMTVTLPANTNITVFEGLFGFDNHAINGYDYWQISNNGVATQANAYSAYAAADLNTGVWWFGPAVNDGNYGNGTKVIPTEQKVRYTAVATEKDIYIYVDDVLVKTIPTTSGIYDGTITLSAANTYEYFDIGLVSTGYNNDTQAPWLWWASAMVVDDVAFYNSALSSEQVASLNPEADREAYAKSIADTLNITMLGRQAGTIDGETAVRFVANLDQDAINGNEAVTKLGWAAENGTAVTEHAKGYTLTTVTTDSKLAETGKYAYTYVQATGSSVAVLPCVQITVNGNDYWFAYDGFSGSAVSTEKSAVVSAIDVEGVFAAAAENTLA